MKKMILVLAATLICGACVFTSCKKDKDNTDLNLKEKIIGKWIVADRNSKTELTNEKKVYTFISATQAYVSASLNARPEIGTQWVNYLETAVAIDGNKMKLTNHPNAQTTAVEEFTVTAISGSEFTANVKLTKTVDGNVVVTNESTIHLVKVTADYTSAILGTWQGHCTSEGSVFDDGEEHRWEYKADGTYTYYVMDGDNWVPSDNSMNQYFVDGKLLCTRWVDNGVENREWWEITIDGTRMHWTALRQNPDGTTFTATFEMEKVN